MKALRFPAYGPPSVLKLVDREMPKPGPGKSLVEIEAAAINPSDVKNVAGAFKSPLPRTPGRDYAGIVVDGAGKGREVWAADPLSASLATVRTPNTLSFPGSGWPTSQEIFRWPKRARLACHSSPPGMVLRLRG